MNKILYDAEIERIAISIVALQEKEDTSLPTMRRQLQECEKAIDNMLNAIPQSVLTSSTKTRLEELKAQKENLETAILQSKLQRPRYTKERVVNWISRFKYGNADAPEYKRQIIDIFINSIYVYDDRLVFTYNFKDEMETITFEDVEAAFGSDLTQVPVPQKGNSFGLFPFFFRPPLLRCIAPTISIIAAQLSPKFHKKLPTASYCNEAVGITFI